MGALAGRERQLAGKVGERLDRRAGTLLDLCAGLGGHARAIFDQGQHLVGFERLGAQTGCGILEPRPELDQRFRHFAKGTGMITACVSKH